jgi:pimeloyl-ACP methyl ester carboxylesterase
MPANSTYRNILLLPALVAATIHAQSLATTPPETLQTPTGTVEVGWIANAPYRIDVPTNWNHSLIVFYHGYSETPYLYKINRPINDQASPMLQRGFAVIESGYSQVGWALEQAVPETDALRTYFISKYGKPTETYVTGGSMGGALTMVTIEQRPDIYTAALALCARLGPTDIPSQQRFAFRAAFDFYFPGIMPPLVPTPPDYVETKELRTKVAAALAANPTNAAYMRNLMHLHNDADVTRMIVYITYVISDFQKRSGGNPFDNRDLIYSGTSLDSTTSDYALNRGVKRYAADPMARQYLIRYYTSTGKLLRPMIELHTTYDQLIPVAGIAIYSEQVAAAGFSNNFVQQYVEREGHCTMSSAEIGRSFDQLLTWVHTGKRPDSGLQH